jgi:hypothetical protein
MGGSVAASNHEVAMADISAINNLLTWKLLSGSHEWPGPDGGTCINEAAIVAAGFRYRPVCGAESLPSNFSSEMGVLLLSLNDTLGDKRRQKLMQFVLRLPGSKDTARVERRRCRHVHDGFVALLERYGLPSDELTGQLPTAEGRAVFAGQAGEVIASAAEHKLPSARADAFLDEALAIVTQAFDIGRQADAADAAIVDARAASVRGLQHA